MANTNITMRIDETLKAQLQELLSNKQAVREQALPFRPDMNVGKYGLEAYKLAIQNTKYDKQGRATISSDDDWVDESEWDDVYEQVKKGKG